MARHLTPMHLIDNFGGSICDAKERKAFQLSNGATRRPWNVRFSTVTGKQTFAAQGVYKVSADKQADALAKQAKFTAVAAAVATAMANPTTLATYKAEWEKQTKYPTLRGYIFAQEYANYNG